MQRPSSQQSKTENLTAKLCTYLLTGRKVFLHLHIGIRKVTKIVSEESFYSDSMLVNILIYLMLL